MTKKNINLLFSFLLILLAGSQLNAETLSRRSQRIKALHNYEKAKTGGKNLVFENGADLSNLNTAKKNLFKVNLPGARLIDVKGNNSNWTGAILTEANLSGGQLQNTILIGALLNGTCLLETDFSGSDLTDANLSGKIKLVKKIWEIITFDYDSKFIKNRINTKFINAILKHADLRYANWINPDFRGADLEKTKLNNNLMMNGNFSSVQNLENTNFSGSALYNANFKNTDISKAYFKNTHFYGTSGISNAQVRILIRKGAKVFEGSHELIINNQKVIQQKTGVIKETIFDNEDFETKIIHHQDGTTSEIIFDDEDE